MKWFDAALSAAGIITPDSGGDNLTAELERLQVSSVFSFDLTDCTQLDVYVTVLERGMQSVFAHAITNRETIKAVHATLLQYPERGTEPSSGIPVYERAYVFGHRPVGMPVQLTFVNGLLLAQNELCYQLPEADETLRSLLEITVPTGSSTSMSPESRSPAMEPESPAAPH